jgi:polyhydroxyalkanoate synthase
MNDDMRRVTENGRFEPISARPAEPAPGPGVGNGRKQPDFKPPSNETPKISSGDIEAFAKNLARMIDEGGRALAAYLRPREESQINEGLSDEFTDMVKTLAAVAEYWLSDPQRAVELQGRLGSAYLDLWGSAVKRLAGKETAPVAHPDPRDRRFADAEWSSNQFFDFVKQAYLLSAHWADQLVKDARTLDPHTRQKAEFYVRQIVNALSPSNFVLTNPELLRETLDSNAENLARGMQMLAEDIEAGGGDIKIRQSDPQAFEIGRNLALTPGKVVFQNALMQLIQYQPATETVLKRPLLIVPPWINKFYVLDLTPDKSFIKWCVDQGLTVFVISWINPDETLAAMDFEQYMRLGPLAALDAIWRATGETDVNAIGYCVGGTLLAVTLAYLAKRRDTRIASATFFAAQVDFTHAGDLKVFVDEEQLAAIEKRMAERGYLDAKKMATAFNMLRSNDLIWPYVINNYLKGKTPMPFDLLYWNSDSTRLPAANHAFYLRKCYHENALTGGKMEIGGERLDLKQVTVPVYNLATREDHIAPAESVFLGATFFGGPMKFVLSGSGHIAGVVNPPGKHKYQYWTGETPNGQSLANWLDKAAEHAGSWWPDWLSWIKSLDDRQVPARQIGSGALRPIEDAPGSYVRIKA